MVAKYRKKPVVIEAFRVGEQPAPVWFSTAVLEGDARVSYEDGHYVHIEIKTLEGTMTAVLGDYIIRGIKGELYPCKADIFHETYELVTDDAAE